MSPESGPDLDIQLERQQGFGNGSDTTTSDPLFFRIGIDVYNDKDGRLEPLVVFFSFFFFQISYQVLLVTTVSSYK